MPSEFRPLEFIERIGAMLVHEFENAAYAGTPGLVGTAKEHPARKRFEMLLPHVAAVGSGLVIDSYGGVSRQQDIVIYERAHCPVFSVNDTPEATYYPCEGVIAVGEVKSTLGSKDLEDAIAKIVSAKRLKRRAIAHAGFQYNRTVPFRQYGSAESAYEKTIEFDQVNKPGDRLLGFVLCEKFRLSEPTLLSRAAELWGSVLPHEMPNIIVSLNDGFIAQNGPELVLRGDAKAAFPELIYLLLGHVRGGRTVELDRFREYMMPQDRPRGSPIRARTPLKTAPP
jgi:hypothetical protein